MKHKARVVLALKGHPKPNYPPISLARLIHSWSVPTAHQTDRQTRGSAHSLGICPGVWLNRHIQHLFLSAELLCTGQGISLFPSYMCAAIINESCRVSCSFQETEKPGSLTLHSHCAVYSRQEPHLARGVKIKPFSQQFWGLIHTSSSSVIPGSCWKCALCLQEQTARWHQPPSLQDKAQEGHRAESTLGKAALCLKV